ncbi:MAG TPA: hypothetical protein VD793_07980 [Gemmatimonadales bacterium]|nr:hypothetical protein [Gemmatimonadales bacterium]
MGFDRRVGERRSRHSTVSADRRRGDDRRTRLPRRETAEGHLRNAIQLLVGLNTDEALAPDVREILGRAVWRLQSALAETKFLLHSRAQLGKHVRRSDPNAQLSAEGTNGV